MPCGRGGCPSRSRECKNRHKSLPTAYPDYGFSDFFAVFRFLGACSSLHWAVRIRFFCLLGILSDLPEDFSRPFTRFCHRRATLHEPGGRKAAVQRSSGSLRRAWAGRGLLPVGQRSVPVGVKVYSRAGEGVASCVVLCMCVKPLGSPGGGPQNKAGTNGGGRSLIRYLCADRPYRACTPLRLPVYARSGEVVARLALPGCCRSIDV